MYFLQGGYDVVYGKMANMGVAEASKYMKGTGHIDHLLTRTNLPQAQKSLDYLNGRLGNMGHEDGIELLRGDNN